MLDTRATGQTLAPQQEFRLSLAGQPGFPADATAALINLTATNTVAPGYVRAYPCGEEQDVSNVNYAAGQTVANLASVKVAAGGDICFKSYAQTDIVVDLAGWYAPGGGGAVRRCRPDPPCSTPAARRASPSWRPTRSSPSSSPAPWCLPAPRRWR